MDIRKALNGEFAKAGKLPCHVEAFRGWVLGRETILKAAVDEASAFSGQSRHPEHVAALGFGVADGLLTPSEIDLFREEAMHLSGRTFFSPGRAWRFEIDGIALLGVSLGIAKCMQRTDRAWLSRLLGRSAQEVSGDPWQLGLVRAAQLVNGETRERIDLPDLAIAMNAKGIGQSEREIVAAGWKLASGLVAHDSGPARDAVRLAAFDYVVERQAQVPIVGTTRDDLITLLQNVGRSMRLWTYESEKRTRKSEIARWDIENEYHVQNLLWAVLAPVFSDLEDEENLPSIGHKKPRADLGIPSLRTIIEVKFMRNSGQPACAKITEEVAADASLYLSRGNSYDNIIAFVWDDCAQTEQHHELKSGLEAINGVSAAIILPRPLKMKRAPIAD